MRRLIVALSLLTLTMSLNGCLFWGGGIQFRPIGELTHPQAEFKYAEQQPPGWIDGIAPEYDGTLYGVGSAYNVMRAYAVEDARVAAMGALAEKIRASLKVESDQTRTTERALGSNSGASQRTIEERVDEVIRNTRVVKTFVYPEEVWGPGGNKIWRKRAYVLVVSDIALYEAVTKR